MAVPNSFFLGLIVGVLALFVSPSSVSPNKSGSVKKVKRSLWLGTSAFYVSLVVYRCFLNREPGSYGQLDLRLWNTVESVSGYHYFIDNVIMFIPAGVLLLLATRAVWKSVGQCMAACVIIGVAISLAIESLQVVTGVGVFHIDDLVANGIGTVIGCVMCTPFLVPGSRLRERGRAEG